MLRRLAYGTPFSLIFLITLLGDWNDTSTGINLDQLRQFPLTKIRSGVLNPGSRATFDGIIATTNSSEPEVRLRGTAKSGKRWEAHLYRLDEVWRADLDGNGTADYVFFGSSPFGNGRTAPPFSVSILLMDRSGLPVPFFDVFYHGENGAGVKHLVDLNGDRKAELLISTYDEIPSDERVIALCSGHWTTQLYQFKDSAAEEYRGSMGGIRFPFVRDWTYRGAQCDPTDSSGATVQPAILYEHGTAAQGKLFTTIRKVDHTSGLLTIDPVKGCTTIHPSVLVYDRPQVREIAFPNPYSSYPANLETTLMRNRARVDLRGISDPSEGSCAVNLVWAK
jgi:hypothetical protein